MLQSGWILLMPGAHSFSPLPGHCCVHSLGLFAASRLRLCLTPFLTPNVFHRVTHCLVTCKHVSFLQRELVLSAKENNSCSCRHRFLHDAAHLLSSRLQQGKGVDQRLHVVLQDRVLHGEQPSIFFRCLRDPSQGTLVCAL